jgi:hypothetical protein
MRHVAILALLLAFVGCQEPAQPIAKPAKVAPAPQAAPAAAPQFTSGPPLSTPPSFWTVSGSLGNATLGPRSLSAAGLPVWAGERGKLPDGITPARAYMIRYLGNGSMVFTTTDGPYVVRQDYEFPQAAISDAVASGGGTFDLTPVP